jgi:hypothetical protein
MRRGDFNKSMSFDFLTEHQIHVLVRALTVGVLFFGALALIAFFSRRGNAAARRKDLQGGKETRIELLPKNGWRGGAGGSGRANRKKRKR